MEKYVKNDLIDIIITEKSKKITYTEENDELTKEETNKLLKNNNISSEVKAKSRPLNNWVYIISLI